MYRNLLIRCAALAVVALTSLVACQRGDNNSYSYKADYLPVQLVGSQKWSILDVNTGEVVVRDAFDEAPSAVVGGMFYVMTPDGLYNYYNVSDTKHPINAEPYGSVTAFGDNGLAVASRRGEALSVIDRTGKVVATLPREVSQCSMFSRGRAAFQNDMGLWGYIDEKGDTVIPARFSNANLFLHADWAVVVPDTQPSDTSALFSVIDLTGKVLFSSDINEHRVIQPVYVDGVLPVVKGDTIVCLDENGKEVANPNGDHSAVDKGGWDDFSRTAGGYFLVVKGGKMGLVDKNNKQLIAPKWDRLIDVTADRYIAGNDSINRLVDLNGNAVGTAQFAHVHGSMENVYAARGIIDTDMAAAAMAMLLSPEGCAGGTAATTLMDMNRALGPEAAPYVGQNGLLIPQGPLVLNYIFDRPIASGDSTTTPTFNYDARLNCVATSLNVMHCGLNTEQEIVNKLSAVLGTRGYVFESEGIFVSEQGPVVALGYEDGIIDMNCYMNRALVKPLARKPRAK